MSATENFHGSQIDSSAIECAVADLMALVRATAEATDTDEYEVRIGIIWTGEKPITILTRDHHGYTYDGVSTPVHRYTPVEITVNAVESEFDFRRRVHDLAEDCVNQGGVSHLRMIQLPALDDSE